MTPPNIIAQLVERFDQQRQVYRTGRYNETQLRREFLDPFFEALGWDMTNRDGIAEIYKEVIHEDSLDIEGENEAPDYAFRIGGTRKFFVEAKKPAVNIEFNIHPAFQLRRYAWSAKLPLGILTDFEEFAIYDCRVKPDKGDKASTARTLLFSYKDYLDKWDEIASIFSREAVLKGSFDSFAETLKSKKGTTEVDDAFLAEIERWRELLAKNIAIQNPNSTVRELNYAVQMTIDRIVFLRICEDRGIERDEQLKEIAAEQNIYGNLYQLFQRADARYNSGLFHFKKEKEQSSTADTLTPDLKIDDKVLEDILKNLYYPESPYVFREIPSDILGQVYERFLGKVIRLTDGHEAKVEEKPEVRKAGGVYYTPAYIVDYIVQNTVGKLLEGKTPKDATKLKILDPACGSGTFPLGAYQYLLDWHLDWYINHEPEKAATGKNPAIFQTKDGWKLTTAKKKEILLNNIFGVDIDAQAVEVTKLSLLLKVLEGENQETIGSQLSFLQERVLPDVGKNIQCGNSLIGPDYYESIQLTMLINEEERYRVNAFDWKGAFPQVFIQGGFDAVIGNPPYVRQETIGDLKNYLQKGYKTFHGTADLYVYFIERGISLLRNNGYFSYIVANKWMRTNYAEPLRKWLKAQDIEEIVDFGDLPVFQDATTYPCIIRICKRTPSLTFESAQMKDLKFTNLLEYVSLNSYTVNKISLDDKGWSLSDEKTQNLLSKLKSKGISLKKYTNGKVYRGLITGLNEAFVINEDVKNDLIEKDKRSAELIKPFLIGREVKRYLVPKSDSHLIFMPRGWTREKSNGAPDAWAWFKENYPTIASYLVQFADKAEQRYDKGEYWWELRACDYYDEFEKVKIVYPNICKRPEFTLELTKSYTNQKCFIIPADDKYLLGILNSSSCYFLFRKILPKLRGDFYEPSYIYFKDFPIRPINFSDSTDKAMHDKVVSLVERMLELHKRSPRTPQEQEMVKREIDSTDRKIDNLVYELYGLSEEEIKIVEGKI
jgi:type I restriction-modification system DNA methylase subunit